MTLNEYSGFTQAFLSEKEIALGNIYLEEEVIEEAYSSIMSTCLQSKQNLSKLSKKNIQIESMFCGSNNLTIVSNERSGTYYDETIKEILQNYGKNIRIIFDDNSSI